MSQEDVNIRVIRLEERVAHMANGMDDLKELTNTTNEKLESTNEKLQSIQQMIAKGQGAWWVVGTLGVLASAAAGIGALVHKFLP